MSKIYFKPWVGKNYATTGYQGKKILVLGESHHDKTGTIDGNATNEVITELLTDYGGGGYQQTFLCFERALAGKVLTDEERNELWQGLVFYNYIQSPLPATRTSPKPEQWGQSAEAFAEVLDTWRPDCILVWGVRLFKGLTDFGGHRGTIDLADGSMAEYRVYPVAGKQVPALKLCHPSSPKGKSWPRWHGVISQFLKMV